MNDSELQNPPRRTHTSKAPLWILGGVVAFVACVLIVRSFSGGGQTGGADVEPLGLAVESVDKVQALGGTTTSPDVQERIERQNTVEAQQALQTGESHFPTITPGSAPLVLPETQAVREQQAPSPEVVPQQQRTVPSVERQSRAERMSSGNLLDAMRQVQEGMNLPGGAMVAITTVRPELDQKKGEEGKNEDAGTNEPMQDQAPASFSGLLDPGKVLYAINEYEVDSDYPATDVILRVVHPQELNGARLFGHFKRQDEILILEMQRFSHLGQEASIRGLAINPEDARANVATEVDTHFLERWGGLLAATFIQGLGEAIARSKTRTTSSDGTTVTSSEDYSSTELILDSAGKVGGRAATQFEQNFNRPPTVRLHPGAEVAVVIIESNRR
jgi:hypothetical protein